MDLLTFAPAAAAAIVATRRNDASVKKSIQTGRRLQKRAKQRFKRLPVRPWGMY